MVVKVLGFKHLVFSPKENPEKKVDCTTVWVATKEIKKDGAGYEVECLNVHESKMPYDDFVLNGCGDYNFNFDMKGKLTDVSFVGNNAFDK